MIEYLINSAITLVISVCLVVLGHHIAVKDYELVTGLKWPATSFVCHVP